MWLKIVEVGDPVLRVPAKDVTTAQLGSPEIARLIDLMRETMRDAPGVGLAAPQVGVPLRLAVIEDSAVLQAGLDPQELAARERVPIPMHVIINPRLTVIEPGPVAFAEGCLSVPNLMAVVPRARAVRVDALDHAGRPVTIEARGWYARILQHEIDHLNGRLYVDVMRSETLTTLRNRNR